MITSDLFDDPLKAVSCFIIHYTLTRFKPLQSQLGELSLTTLFQFEEEMFQNSK